MCNKFESLTLGNIIGPDSKSFFQTMRLHHFEKFSRFCYDWLGISYISQREKTGIHLVPWELESSSTNDELFFQFSKKRVLLTFKRSVAQIINMGHAEKLAQDLLLGFRTAYQNPEVFTKLCLILFSIWDLTVRNAEKSRNAYLYKEDEKELANSLRTGKNPTEILKGLKSLLAKKQSEVRSCVEDWDGVVEEVNRESYLNFLDCINNLALRTEDLSEFFWNPNWAQYIVFLNIFGELVCSSLEDDRSVDVYFFWEDIRKSLTNGSHNIGSICEKQIQKCQRQVFYLKDVFGKTFPEETPSLFKKVELDTAIYWHWLKLSQVHPDFEVVLNLEPDSTCNACLGGAGIGEHCKDQTQGGSTDKHAYIALSEILQQNVTELPPEKNQTVLRIPIRMFYDVGFVEAFNKKFISSIRKEVNGCE